MKLVALLIPFTMAFPALAQNTPSGAPALDMLARLEIERVLEIERGLGYSREADAIMNQTRDALRDLEAKRDRALASLVKVDAGLKKIGQLYPTSTLIPIFLDAQIIEAETEAGPVKSATAKARDLIAKNKFQAGRAVIEDMASEVRVTSVNLPMRTYPQLIKSALTAMKEKKPAPEVRYLLLSAVQSLVVRTKTIPLPIIRAEAFIRRAGFLFDIDGKLADPEIKSLLEAAIAQLSLAERLGYGPREMDYGKLHGALKRLQESSGAKEEPHAPATQSLLTELRGDIRALRDQSVQSAESRGPVPVDSVKR